MSAINHQRPYLKYIDNVRRELYSMAVFSKSKNELSNGQKRSSEKQPRLKGQQLFKEMEQINLSQNESEKILDIIQKINQHIQYECDWLEAFMQKNKRSQKIKKEQKILLESIVNITMQLIASEIVAQNEGREKGVFDWFNLLGKYLHKNGLADLWEFLTDCVFTKAFESLDHILNKPLEGQST